MNNRKSYCLLSSILNRQIFLFEGLFFNPSKVSIIYNRKGVVFNENKLKAIIEESETGRFYNFPANFLFIS